MDLVAFIFGLVVGIVICYLLLRKRLQSASVFLDEDDAAANVLRQEAAASIADRTNKRFDRIMEKAKQEGKITNDGVEDLFCITNSTASRYLRLLVEDGRLERHGSGRGTYYTPKT